MIKQTQIIRPISKQSKINIYNHNKLNRLQFNNNTINPTKTINNNKNNSIYNLINTNNNNKIKTNKTYKMHKTISSKIQINYKKYMMISKNYDIYIFLISIFIIYSIYLIIMVQSNIKKSHPNINITHNIYKQYTYKLLKLYKYNQTMIKNKFKKRTSIQDNSYQPQSNLPQSNNDLRNTIASLQKMYQTQLQKRMQLEQHLIQYKKRAIAVQRQFQIIISKYKNRPQTDPNSKFHLEIQGIYKQILTNFDKSNQATHQFLQKKYQNNQQSMQRCVEQIRTNMEAQLKKHIKLSKQSYDNITREVRWALENALKIQQNNVEVIQKNKILQFNNKLIKQQRSLLINQIVEKKQIIKQLSDKLTAYEDYYTDSKSSRMNHKQSEQILLDLPQQSFKVNHTTMNYTTLQKHNKIMSNKPLHNKTISSHSRRPKTPMTPTSQHFDQSIKNKSLNHTKIKTITPQKMSSLNKQSFFEHKISNQMLQFDQYYKNNKIRGNPLKLQKKTVSALQFNSKELPQCGCNLDRKSYEQTIDHLKKNIRRLKIKVYELQKLMGGYEMKNKEINEALQLAIRQSYQKTQQATHTNKSNAQQGSSPGKLELIVKSQKLFESLKMIKRRLSMLEFPGVSCGWGNIGYEV